MSVALLRGNARALPLPDASVDLIVTSPPYFALRSYTDAGIHYPGQIGDEPTPAEFLDSLIACTAEMVRVLKPSGSIFINLGDKYASNSNGTIGHRAGSRDLTASQRGRGERFGAPVKSLLLIPERFRIRCVDELGLICRSVTVWDKPNGLPESVTDRVRRSHEDWAHFTISPRYYAAIDRIREPHKSADRGPRAVGTRNATPRHAAAADHTGWKDTGAGHNVLGALPGSVWTVPTEPLTIPEHVAHAHCCDGVAQPGCEDSLDHHAAFPTAWPRRIIQGWSPQHVCTACGEGRAPISVIAAREPNDAASIRTRARTSSAVGTHVGSTLGYSAESAARRVIGEGCACPDNTAPTTPGVVLDPFGGTGTTALVADVLGRDGISVDMSGDYGRIASWRTTDPGQRAKAARRPFKASPKPAQGQGSLLDLPAEGATA